MEITYENGELVIRIPASEEQCKTAPVSTSGKSRLVATTSGFSQVPGGPDGLKLSLNLIAKK